MSQNYQNFPKFCDLSVKVAPDLKFKEKIGFRFEKKIKNWASFGVKISIFLKKWGLWMTAHNFCGKIWGLWVRLEKYMGLLVRTMLKIGVLTALHVSPPEFRLIVYQTGVRSTFTMSAAF